MKQVKLEELNVGDFIHVYWFDHSKVSRGPFSSPECPAHHYGIYAGVWSGKEDKKHLRLYIGDFMDGAAATYLDILIGEISTIELILPRLVDPEQIRRVKRYVMMMNRRRWS